MYGSFVVERGDDSVGFILFWSDSVDVSLLSYSKAHIDVEIRDSSDHSRFTRGGLNAILCHDEKEDGRRKPQNIVRCNWNMSNGSVRERLALMGAGLHEWQTK
ncbi:hypothetical protein V6N13_037811 [Hibiscus sabdariffa]